MGSTPTFLSRLLRASSDLIDGEISWQKFRSEIPNNELQKIHRFNISLPKGEAPALDDVRKISSLERETRSAFNQGDRKLKVTRAARSLLANLFFLELKDCEKLVHSADHPPGFLCKGYICCRLRLGARGQRPLVRKLRDDHCRFLVKDKQVDLPKELILGVESGSDFSLYVEFYSGNPESEKLSICLTFHNSSERFPISGFPRAPKEVSAVKHRIHHRAPFFFEIEIMIPN
jgi:hypothetical protein